MKKIIHKKRTKTINGSRLKRRHKRPKVHYVGTIEFISSVPGTQTVPDSFLHAFDTSTFVMQCSVANGSNCMTSDPANTSVWYVMFTMEPTSPVPDCTTQLVCTGNVGLWLAANHPSLLGVLNDTQRLATRSEVNAVLNSCTPAPTDQVVFSYSNVTATSHYTDGSGNSYTTYTYTSITSVTIAFDLMA